MRGATTVGHRASPSPGGAGRTERARLHVVDILPTLLEVARAEAKPTGHAGESFLPLLQGRSWNRSAPLFFQYMDNRAIRTRLWTLAEVDGAGWELFDLNRDPLETQNVASEHPAVVSRLETQWLDWWRSESGKPAYEPKTTRSSPHYKPQGDRGSGVPYVPSAMPPRLAGRHPLPQ